jgi:hypothetical protein
VGKVVDDHVEELDLDGREAALRDEIGESPLFISRTTGRGGIARRAIRRHFVKVMSVQ